MMQAQTPGEPSPINRILKIVSLFAIAVGVSLMVGMVIWSHRLDGDFSGSYACCTQAAIADFHQRFWSRFFVGAKVAIVGCLALSAMLPSRATVKAGQLTVGASVAGVLLSFIGTNLHGWTGASAITLSEVVFCGGAALLFIGGCRLGWMALRSHKR
jgi:hypothetical protein